MSIADEARAEADRRIIEGTLDIAGGWAEDIFAAGAEWLASRKPEAAPSDTDREALIDAVAQVMFEPPSLGQDDPEYTWAQMVVEDPTRADMYRQDAAAALEAAARTSQPVQVEVTDNTKLIDRAREMRMDAEVGTHVERMRILGELANALQATDAALVAALGGGDQ